MGQKTTTTLQQRPAGGTLLCAEPVTDEPVGRDGVEDGDVTAATRRGCAVVREAMSTINQFTTCIEGRCNGPVDDDDQQADEKSRRLVMNQMGLKMTMTLQGDPQGVHRSVGSSVDDEPARQSTTSATVNGSTDGDDGQASKEILPPDHKDEGAGGKFSARRH